MVFIGNLMFSKNRSSIFYTESNSKFPNFHVEIILKFEIKISHRKNHQMTSGFLLRSRNYIYSTELHSQRPQPEPPEKGERKTVKINIILVYCMAISYGP